MIRCDIAVLAGAATMLAYRGRGFHSAPHLEGRAGRDLAAECAEPGRTSQRNAERPGLRISSPRAILDRYQV